MIVVVVAIALLVAIALAWRPAIDPVDPPAPQTFDGTLVEHGAALALLGNCTECHTAAAGVSFAGGVPVETPFGTIYATNVTPDPETGIGRWSEEAFRRAMREGVARDGRHLYPAFPYNHFTRLSDDDIRALYAYLMTRDPVRATAPRNELVFPLQFRPLLAGWKLLFLDRGPHRGDPAQSEQWNRGAYLVQAVAHCGACHTPRNALGAEQRDRSLSGGESAGWHAPALEASSPSPMPWSADQLFGYLRTGLVRGHAIAAGPMLDVVASLGRAPEDDVRAIATYIESTLGESGKVREARAAAARERAQAGTLGLPADARGDATLELGHAVYVNACASCHEAGRTLSSAGAMPLPLAIAVHNPQPANLLNIVLDGIAPLEGERGRWMPAFSGALTDDQLVALAAFLRRAAANEPPWPDLPGAVRKARSS